MRIITLNIWGGQLYGPLMAFIQREAATTDIFCLQEVLRAAEPIEQPNRGEYRADILDQLQETLSDFDTYFSVEQDHYAPGAKELLPENIECGNAIFVRKTLSILDKGEAFVHGQRNSWRGGPKHNFPRLVQWVVVPHGDEQLLVANFHGHHLPGEKIDTEDRIDQSKRVRAAIGSFEGPKVLTGDFNLWPETESLAILASGLKDLIKEHGITSTRSSNHFHWPRKYSDYTLVSPELTVAEFKVLPDEVSDHLPLVLDIN
jgi:endonuclease/exonuclease/phosphatase family metal-dependent hydrolase